MGDKHIPALDGIRGVAILLVLLVHFIPPVAMQWRIAEWFMKVFSTGGWVGVDLFFVLSGFLITGILLRTKDGPGYFTNFYMRRTLRIFPLYFAALAIVFIVLPYFFVTPLFTEAQTHQGFFWLYLSNIAVFRFGFPALDSDIVSPSAYWSLAIEEQFYLIWPAVVFFSRARSLKIICISVIVAALLIRCAGVLTFGASSMFFYLTPCRMDGLASGALVAAVLHERGASGIKPWIRTIAASALVAIGALLAFFLATKGLWAGHWFIRTVGLSMLAGIFSAILIVAVVYPGSVMSKLLKTPLLRFFGKYSYGLYVIHALMIPTLSAALPAADWMNRFGDQTMIGAISLAVAKILVCTVLAVACYHLYEMPFLRLKRYFEPTQLPSGLQQVGYGKF